MRYAVKNKGKIVNAYCLGQGSGMEQFLLELGRIRRLPDGGYELMSQEAKNGVGQRAEAGDYFKVAQVDGAYFPYPNSRAYFLDNHTHLEGDCYEQKVLPLAIWQWGDGPFDAVDHLLETGKLTLDHGEETRFFNAFLWGAALSAARDATVVFYDIVRDASGAVEDVSFNFVAKEEFERSYTVCTEQAP